MDTVTMQKRTWEIYSQAEADEKKIPYVPWRDIVGPGYWALTDDGYVMELVRIWTGKNKNGQVATMKQFSGGRVWQGRTTKFEWLPRKARHAIYTSVPDAWARKEAKTRRAKNVVKLMAGYMVAGQKPDFVALGNAYRPDQKVPEATVKRLFKNPEIQKMLDQELVRVLTGLGLDKKFVLTHMKMVVDISKEKGDLTNMRLQLHDLGEILDVFPKNRMGGNGFDGREIPVIEQEEDPLMLEDGDRMRDANLRTGKAEETIPIEIVTEAPTAIPGL